MYQSKIKISQKNKSSLEKDLNHFLMYHKKWYCRVLKRKISLEKLPDAIVKRSSSSRRRLQCFFVSIDVLRNSKKVVSRIEKGFLEYEVIGCDSTGKKIRVHLREEISNKKDKELFFISCF